ncbi:MAG: hypothetical protein OXN89_11040 [Bryobacterales bacterium]|nr:hypothetical protein [Bryobacterales bacterium]
MSESRCRTCGHCELQIETEALIGAVELEAPEARRRQGGGEVEDLLAHVLQTTLSWHRSP